MSAGPRFPTPIGVLLRRDNWSLWGITKAEWAAAATALSAKAGISVDRIWVHDNLHTLLEKVEPVPGAGVWSLEFLASELVLTRRVKVMTGFTKGWPTGWKLQLHNHAGPARYWTTGLWEVWLNGDLVASGRD